MNQIDQAGLNNSYNSTHTLCNECNKDTNNRILFFVEPKHNIKASTLVCKAWNKAATDVAKIQLISNKEEEIGTQMHGFLSMTCQKMEDCCPIFQELFVSRHERSIKNVYKILANLTKPHIGSKRGCYFSKQLGLATWLYQEVDSSRFDNFEKPVGQLVEEMKTAIQDKQVEIIEKNQPFIDLSICPRINRAEKCYFPIELFDMKSELVNNELKLVNVRKYDHFRMTEGMCIKTWNYCFPFEGRLMKIEFSVYVHIDRYYKPSDVITVENNMSPAMCYNPSVDAGAPITLASIEQKIETAEKGK